MSNWKEIAEDARKAADLCHQRGRYRSAVSRSYYAMFAMVTAAMRQRNLTPPADRETWSHARVPYMVMTYLRNDLGTQATNDLIRRLNEAYRKRIGADYYSSVVVDEVAARRSVADTRAVIGILEHQT